MVVAKDAIVTLTRVGKAKSLNMDGVQRLAAFVQASSLDPQDIYLACQRNRNEDLGWRRQHIDRLYRSTPELQNRRRR